MRIGYYQECGRLEHSSVIECRAKDEKDQHSMNNSRFMKHNKTLCRLCNPEKNRRKSRFHSLIGSNSSSLRKEMPARPHLDVQPSTSHRSVDYPLGRWPERIPGRLWWPVLGLATKQQHAVCSRTALNYFMCQVLLLFAPSFEPLSSPQSDAMSHHSSTLAHFVSRTDERSRRPGDLY